MFEGIDMNNIKRSIWVTFRLEGIHCYPEAGTDPKLEDVNFLQFPHRHQFGFKVEISVNHNDREIEFIQFKRWLQSLYSVNTSMNSSGSNVLDLNGKSCEDIASGLINQIDMKYPGRSITVSVDEDGENGCTLVAAPQG